MKLLTETKAEVNLSATGETPPGKGTRARAAHQGVEHRAKVNPGAILNQRS